MLGRNHGRGRGRGSGACSLRKACAPSRWVFGVTPRLFISSPTVRVRRRRGPPASPSATFPRSHRRQGAATPPSSTQAWLRCGARCRRSCLALDPLVPGAARLRARRWRNRRRGVLDGLLRLLHSIRAMDTAGTCSLTAGRKTRCASSLFRRRRVASDPGLLRAHCVVEREAVGFRRAEATGKVGLEPRVFSRLEEQQRLVGGNV
jgi:hypothetical protein